jgi:transcriptional regulator with XRE-family HTH domain
MKRACRSGQALAELRVLLEASRAQIARALGVSQANVSRIEHTNDVQLFT